MFSNHIKAAYRTDMNLKVSILAELEALIIVLLTISYQSIKAALVNPVENLRYE